MSPPSQKPSLLLTISISHFAEKARWALAYYRVPHTERVLMPGFHVPVVMSYLKYLDPEEVAARKPGSRGTELPMLVVFKSDEGGGGDAVVERVVQGSGKIVRYLGERYATDERPDLYRSCGEGRRGEVEELERRYDDLLGPAARTWAYYDMLVENKWRSFGGWANLGFRNPVGWFQGVSWMLLSPLLRLLIMSEVKVSKRTGGNALRECKDMVQEVSKCELVLPRVSCRLVLSCVLYQASTRLRTWQVMLSVLRI